MYNIPDIVRGGVGIGDVDVFSPIQGTLLEYTNYISDTVRGVGGMGDIEVFGPIQGAFLCRLSKDLALTASQGTEVIHRYFTYTYHVGAVGNTQTMNLMYNIMTWHLFIPRSLLLQ